MNRKRAQTIGATLLVPVCGLFIGFYFFYSFGHLSTILRWLGAVSLAVILSVGAVFAFLATSGLGAVARGICVLTAMCGMAVLGVRADVFPAPMGVSVNGQGVEGSSLPADLKNVRGKSLWTYQLNPGVLAGRTLTVSFPMTAQHLKVYLSGAAGSWQSSASDAAPALVLRASGGSVASTASRKENLSFNAAELAGHQWQVRHVHISNGGASLLHWTMAVPDAESLAAQRAIYLAVQVKGWQGWLFAAGKVLLCGLAVWTIAITMALALTAIRTSRAPVSAVVPSSAPRIPIPGWIVPVAGFIALVGILVYWSSSRTQYIFFWDYRIHWVRAQQLFGLMTASGWSQTLDALISYYPANYSMLPAFIPALLSLVSGYPGRVDYALLIALVYAVPTYMLLAYSGRQLVSPLHVADRRSWVWSAFAVLFATPIYLGVILYMMPDMGGVALTAGALLMAHHVIHQTGTAASAALDAKSPPRVAASALGLGLALAAMFLYRRWYVFASIGISAALLFFFALDWVRCGVSWSALRPRLRYLILIAFAALPLLSPVIVDWAANVGAHDYSLLYSSYKLSASFDYLRFSSSIGILVPIGVTAFYICAIRLKLDRRFLGMLLIASMVSVVLFYRVQSPALHHYYLLMPFLGIGVAGAFQYVWGRFGARAAVAAVCCITIYGAAITMKPALPSTIQHLFPGYTTWLPKKQPGAEGIIALTKWLLSPSMKSRAFCLIASSMELNQSMLAESWQIVPSVPHYPFVGRLVNMAQVDSVNGPPFETIRDCDIALVATPLQQHLEDGKQDNVEILWREISGKYGIGVHFDELRPMFDLGGGIVVTPYQRISDISHQEYLRLVERYRGMKAREAAAAH